MSGGFPLSDLETAIISADPAGVRAAIAAGAHVDERGHEGMTPLMLATLGGNVEVVQALLRGGADPNATVAAGDGRRWSALRLGSASGLRAVVRLLQDAGARPLDAAERHAHELNAMYLSDLAEHTAWWPGLDGDLYDAALRALEPCFRAPATEAALDSFEAKAGASLPADLRTFLLRSNGLKAMVGRGIFGVEDWEAYREIGLGDWLDPGDRVWPAEAESVLEYRFTLPPKRYEWFTFTATFAESYLIAVTDIDDEVEILLRPPSLNRTRSWDLLYLHMAAEHHVRYADARSLLIDLALSPWVYEANVSAGEHDPG